MTAIFCENQHGAKWLRAYHTVVRQVFFIAMSNWKKEKKTSCLVHDVPGVIIIGQSSCMSAEQKKSGLTTAKPAISWNFGVQKEIFYFYNHFSNKNHGRFSQMIPVWCFEISYPNRYWPENYDLYFKWKRKYYWIDWRS